MADHIIAATQITGSILHTTHDESPHKKTGESPGKAVRVYEVEVTARPLAAQHETASWTLSKRFSDFADLREELLDEVKNDAALVAAVKKEDFPTKFAPFTGEEALATERKTQLSTWLAGVRKALDYPDPANWAELHEEAAERVNAFLAKPTEEPAAGAEEAEAAPEAEGEAEAEGVVGKLDAEPEAEEEAADETAVAAAAAAAVEDSAAGDGVDANLGMRQRRGKKSGGAAAMEPTVVEEVEPTTPSSELSSKTSSSDGFVKVASPMPEEDTTEAEPETEELEPEPEAKSEPEEPEPEPEPEPVRNVRRGRKQRTPSEERAREQRHRDHADRELADMAASEKQAMCGIVLVFAVMLVAIMLPDKYVA